MAFEKQTNKGLSTKQSYLKNFEILSQERRCPTMNVVYYAPSMDTLVHETWGLLEGIDPQYGLELHRSLNSLDNRLRHPPGGIGVVLIYIADKQELEDILKLAGLLSDLPLVVILKDPETEIIEHARSLKPRVILDSCFDVAAVGSVVESVMKRSMNRLGRKSVN
jgi:hypothetical protein